MPTIIDALIVTLGMDTSGYKRGQQETAEAIKKTRQEASYAAKDLQSSGTKAAEFFTPLQKGAAQLLSLIAAGDIAKYATNTVNSFSAMNRAATMMNMPVDQMQAFGNYIARTGGDAKTAEASLQSLAQTLEQFRVSGNLPNDTLQAMSVIHGSPTDSPLEVVRKFAAWAKNQKDPNLVNLEGQRLGLDEGTIYAARTRGARGMQAGMAESYSLGVMTPEQVAKMNASREALTRLRQELQGDANDLVADMSAAAPALDALTALLKAFPAATQTIMAMAGLMVLFGSGKVAAGVLRAAAVLAGGGKGGAAAVATEAEVAGAAGAAAGASKFGGLGIIGVLIGMGIDITKHGLSLPKGVRMPWDKSDGGRGHIDKATGYWISDGSAAPHAARAAAVAHGAPGAATGARSAATMAAPASARSAQAYLAGLENAAGLPAGLLDSIWSQESGRGRHMLSPKGAKGHFQFMDATAKQYGVKNPFDFDDSAKGAAHYFADLFRHYSGNASEAIAAYNWGQGHVDKQIRAHGQDWDKFLPPETRAYLRSVGGRIGISQQAANGTTIHIDNLTVNAPHAKNAKDIADHIGEAIRRNGLVQAANSGLS